MAYPLIALIALIDESMVKSSSESKKSGTPTRIIHFSHVPRLIPVRNCAVSKMREHPRMT